MKELENLKSLLQQNNIENLPNAEYISDAVAAMESLLAQNEAYRTSINGVSEGFTEENITAEGMNFHDWRKGFSAATGKMRIKLDSIASQKF